MRTLCGLLLACCILPCSSARGQSRPAVMPPRLIDMPHPDCRSGRSCHGEHGRVRLIVEVLEDSRVGDVRGEMGEPDLVAAATQAAYQTVFAPGTYHGKPKSMNFVLNLSF